MSELPIVSVVMPAFNAGSVIDAAIRSVLAQTYRSIEVIMIDDGSVDETGSAIAKFRDRRLRVVHHHVRKGLATRLNEGIGLARGAYIARMDADDIAYPERLERQLDYMQKHPQVSLVGCAAMAFRHRDAAIGVIDVAIDHAKICSSPASGFNLPHPTWFGRKSFFQRFPYTETASRAQDQDLLLRAHRQAVFANLPEVLLGYRQEQVSARNIVRGRMHYGRAIIAYGMSQSDYGLLVRGLATQLTRGGVVPALVALGYSDYVLQRRCRTPRAEELARWRDVADMAHPAAPRAPKSQTCQA